MDEQEKKDLPEEGDGKGHSEPREGQAPLEEGRVREPGPEDDNGGTGGSPPEEGASGEAPEGAEGETGAATESDRLRGQGYISIGELRSGLKRCYKHVASDEVPVVVMITGKPAWYPITNVESIENAADGSQAVIITLMPMPDDLAKEKPSIEVVKKMPRRPEDAN